MHDKIVNIFLIMQIAFECDLCGLTKITKYEDWK